MIRADRTPPTSFAAGERICYRCGISWTDSHHWWVRSAPCADCRKQLRREHVDLEQFKRKAAA